MCNENYMVEPCPWCGEYPEFNYADYTGTYWAECENAECPAMPSIDGGGSLADAVGKWNKRKGGGRRAVAPANCPFCGERALLMEGKYGFAVECSRCGGQMPHKNILGAVEKWNRRA